jgi:catechol 2,3-dioxygenase-like lactoylglutathione lyase family enzyme
LSACRIDHIVITAPSLQVGGAFVERILGVRPQRGGEHPRMGTHNLLLRLGDSAFLEVIAVNPEAPPPTRPRWFGLDERDRNAPPRLAAWVAQTDDIHRAVALASEPIGEIEEATRGTLNWLITIPRDGRLVLDGVAPFLIQWATGHSPASALPDAGCSLVKLEAFHPDASRITTLFEHLKIEPAVEVRPAAAGVRGYLAAHILTPHGVRILSTPWPTRD